MLIHSVFFWLRAALTTEDRKRFHEELCLLKAISTVRSLYVGAPADTRKAVIDSTYDFGLTVIFADIAGHDAYQVHPLHHEFLNKFSGMWEKVLIYDFECKE